MENPNEHGTVLIHAEGKGAESRCYPGPTHDKRSVKYKAVKPGLIPFPIFKNGFNPRMLSLHGEKITIYAKNMTLQFDSEGNVKTLPVNEWKG